MAASSRQIWADGEHVIIQWTGNAVARDGGPYHNDYVWIFRMRARRSTSLPSSTLFPTTLSSAACPARIRPARDRAACLPGHRAGTRV